jgi:integral membrane protein (TIGR01906 family)
VRFKHWAFWPQRCKISDRDKKLKVFIILAKWLFILCLPFLVLTASLAWAFNSLWLYEYGFNKYQVGITTGLTAPELEKAASGIISYFNSDGEYISLTVVKNGEPFEIFNQREIIHLKDVKGLVWLDYWVLLGTSVYALAYAGVCLLWKKRRYWRHLAWGLVGGGSLTLGLMLALGLGVLFNFDWLFLHFHLISFSNDFWLLNPARDYLEMLFPEHFYYDATIFCASITAGLAIILGGVGGGYLLLTKRKK